MRGLLFLLLCLSAATARAQALPASALRSRSAVLSDYRTAYVGTNLPTAGWTGSVETCDPGALPPATIAAVRRRLNYFRRQAGLYDSCIFLAVHFPAQQAAVLMMTANGKLAHYPPESWRCYTAEGHRAAGRSNLSYGTGSHHSTDALTGQMEDAGSGNVSVGHRQYILSSSTDEFSCGSTENAFALYVFGGHDWRRTKPPFVAWPPAGYVPAPLVFERWSFAVPGAKMEGACVRMTDSAGRAVPLEIISSDTDYGDPTIVWVPEGIGPSGKDRRFTVVVSGVRDAPQETYSYTVTIIQP